MEDVLDFSSCSKATNDQFGFFKATFFLIDHPEIPPLISVKKDQQAEYKRVRDVFASVKIGNNECIQKKLYKPFELSNAGEFSDKVSSCLIIPFQ